MITIYPCPTCGDRTTVIETRGERRCRMCRTAPSFYPLERPEAQQRPRCDGAPGGHDDEAIDWDNELGA